MFCAAPETDLSLLPQRAEQMDHVSSELPTAASLNRFLSDSQPAEIVRTARDLIGRERLAVVSSFGVESAALLKVVAEVDPAIPVLLLDTGWLFPETISHRDRIIAELGLTDVRSIKPDPNALARRDPAADLWSTDPDACCALRKVEPLADALVPFAAWINGRKRYHGGERARMTVVEHDGARLKFNPLARVTPAEVAAIAAAAGLPKHPLAGHGFTSVGCMPCTRRARPGESARAGRWSGTSKTECGIHTVRPATA
jgi:phosphoadenosine phosphosulfate reductase